MFAKFAPVRNANGYDIRFVYRDGTGKIIADIVKEKNYGLDVSSLPVFKPFSLFVETIGNTKRGNFEEQFRGYKIGVSKISPIRKKNVEKRKHSQYSDYLKSEYWTKQRKIILKKNGGRCCFCNSDRNLCVHHRTYSHRGETVEERKDLFIFCRDCHEALHRIRPIDGKIRM